LFSCREKRLITSEIRHKERLRKGSYRESLSLTLASSLEVLFTSLFYRT